MEWTLCLLWCTCLHRPGATGGFLGLLHTRRTFRTLVLRFSFATLFPSLFLREKGAGRFLGEASRRKFFPEACFSSFSAQKNVLKFSRQRSERSGSSSARTLCCEMDVFACVRGCRPPLPRQLLAPVPKRNALPRKVETLARTLASFTTCIHGPASFLCP